ncbi:MAG: Bor family protein [Bacteroidales bacterium]|nr:Bor family protein [Bacteroidales bacterium]
MKRTIYLLLTLLVLAFCGTSCMTTRTAVGNFTESNGEIYRYSKAKQCYLFWGLIPLGRTSAATPQEQPCQVRTSFNFWDALISGITGGIFSMQTIKVYAKRPTNGTAEIEAIKPEPVEDIGQ